MTSIVSQSEINFIQPISTGAFNSLDQTERKDSGNFLKERIAPLSVLELCYSFPEFDALFSFLKKMLVTRAFL
jgi:hypothetical protein